MTENISYKRAVCDICGKEERIDQSIPLPSDWDEVKCFGRFKYDCCKDCLVEIEDLLEKLKIKKHF